MLGAAAFAQPANDNCASATAVTVGSVAVDNTGATNDGLASCATSGQDIWYSFTPATTASYRIDTCSGTLDTVLAVFDGCGGTELACDDDFCGFVSGSSVFPNLNAGTAYLIRVAGFGATVGATTLTITELVPPPNDNCSAAIDVALGATSFDNSGATTDGSASCGFGGEPGGADIWFRFNPSASGFYRFSTCGSSIDTIVSVLSACGGTELACNDDACGAASTAAASLTAGTPVFVRVAGFEGAQGAGTLDVSQFTPPTNDFCTSPAVISVGSTAFDNTDATTDGTDSCGTFGGIGGNDLWYSFTAPNAGNFSFDTCSGTLDTILNLFDGCAGTELACNDDFCGLRSRVVLTMTSGQNILVRVAGWNSVTGASTITIQELIPPSNDNCASASVAMIGDNAFDTQAATTDGSASCGFNGDPGQFDVWFRFTPATSGPYSLSTCSAAFDTILSLYDSCGGTEIACNDDSCGLRSSISVSLTAGTTYFIRIAGWGGAVGTGNLTIGIPAANDLCTGASVVVPGTTYTFDTSGASIENPPTAAGCVGNGSGSLYYSYTATGNGSALIDLCGSSFDTAVAVFPDCNSTGAVPCNDDFCGLQSQLTIGITSGTTYIIRISGFGTAFGAGQFTITETIITGCQPNYGIATGGSAFEDISATGTALGLTDDSNAIVPIGFSFDFYGSMFTDVAVCSNGFLQFNTGSNDFTNDAIPNTNAPNNIACPMWDDLNPGAGGAVYTLSRGTAPNREFIASWQGVPQFNNTDSNTFQVVLRENGTMEFRYGTITAEAPAGDYSVGVENAGGLSGASVAGASLGSGNVSLTVSPLPCSQCDDIDFNNDGVFPDSTDISDLLSVFAGGPCSTDPTPGCNDLDFNNDGVFPDNDDIFAFLRVFSGGDC
jgi:hypothetical protein